MNCEAIISKFPDSTLGPEGVGVRTSCQRCEVYNVHLLRRTTVRDLRSAKEGVNIILQHCPKLIEQGFIEEQIPQELLPSIESF